MFAPTCKVIFLAVGLSSLLDAIDCVSHSSKYQSYPKAKLTDLPPETHGPTTFNCSERGNHNSMFCRFTNLCYSHHRGSFVALGDETDQGYSVGNLDLDLTAAVNRQSKFWCSEQPVTDAGEVHASRSLPGTHVIFSRFASGNLFHFFQDEMIPLFQTLREEGELHNRDRLTLIIADKHDLGCCPDLYGVFSASPPLKLDDLIPDESGDVLTCFDDAIVGLSKETVWFEYSLVGPEGPVWDSLATAEHIRDFAKFFKDRLGIYPNCHGEVFGILLSRKSNRRIVNEEDLATAIASEYQMQMEILSLEEYPLSHLIERASCATLIAGVHGAFLTVSLFLPPDSVILEIIPYALHADYLSHYRTMASLPGMGIEYVYWRNYDRARTMEHPHAPASFGGISHLSREKREAIEKSEEVSPLKGTLHPEWRFRLFQDTIVDIPTVLRLVNTTNLKEEVQRKMQSRRYLQPVLSLYSKAMAYLRRISPFSHSNREHFINKHGIDTLVVPGNA